MKENTGQQLKTANKNMGASWEAGEGLSKCLNQISSKLEQINYDLINNGSVEGRKEYMNSTLKPLLIEWFGDWVPED